MMNDIVVSQISDTEILLSWRMEVLRCVFSIPEDADTAALEQVNRHYYERHLSDNSHIACIASIGGEAAGCGGVCFQEEMPSPDNPYGRCAYLMNIYVRPGYRGKGVAHRIVRWLVGQALAQGTSKIYLETSDAARNLYAGFGFKYMKDMMKIDAV